MTENSNFFKEKIANIRGNMIWWSNSKVRRTPWILIECVRTSEWAGFSGQTNGFTGRRQAMCRGELYKMRLGPPNFGPRFSYRQRWRHVCSSRIINYSFYHWLVEIVDIKTQHKHRVYYFSKNIRFNHPCNLKTCVSVIDIKILSKILYTALVITLDLCLVRV